MVPSSKHRSGIEKKSNEPEALCGVELKSAVNLVLLTRQHNDLFSQLEAEKEKERMWDQMLAPHGTGWWNKPADQLSQDELNQINSLRESVHNVLQQKLRVRDSNPAETSTSTATTANGNGRLRRQRRRR
ncbi:hypothetical protein SLE2022_387720 [Rubroshorea leprosula]